MEQVERQREWWAQQPGQPEPDGEWEPEPVRPRRRRAVPVTLLLAAALAGAGFGFHYLSAGGRGTTTSDGADSYPSGTWSVLSGSDSWSFTVKDTSVSALTLSVVHRSHGTDCGTTGYAGTIRVSGQGVQLAALGDGPQSLVAACGIAPLTLIQDVSGTLESELSDGSTLILGSTLHPNGRPAAG